MSILVRFPSQRLASIRVALGFHQLCRKPIEQPKTLDQRLMRKINLFSLGALIITLLLCWSTPLHAQLSDITQPGDPIVPSSNNRSEEHTSELQSRLHLVCRLLLE